MFSPTEEKVLKVLGKRAMTIHDITERLYQGETKPMGANNKVAAVVRRINQKCDYHRLDWFLNGMGIGRGGKTVWKDKRT